MPPALVATELEGVEIGAYLLVTLDGNSEDEVDALVEQAAELLLKYRKPETPVGIVRNAGRKDETATW